MSVSSMSVNSDTPEFVLVFAVPTPSNTGGELKGEEYQDADTEGE